MPTINKSNVLSTAKYTLEGSKVVLKVFPVPGLDAVADVLLALIKSVEGVQGNEEEVKALSGKILELVKAIESTRKNTQERIDKYPRNDPTRRKLEDRLRESELLDWVNELHERLDDVNTQAGDLNKGFFGKYLQASQTAKTLQKLQGDVSSALRDFQGSIISFKFQFVIKSIVEEVMENLDELKEGFERSEAAVIAGSLQDLPRANASYRAYDNAPKSKFLPNTRIELFKELDAWAERRPDLSSKSICVLTGGVGTGKSTIASEFARRLADRGSYGASFFFDCGIEDVSTPRLFFSTLAYQMAQAQKSLRIPIVNAAREYLKGDRHQTMERQGEGLFLRPISQVDSGHDTVFLVVDAIDECKELASALLNNLMTYIRQAPFPLRVFITSMLPDANEELHALFRDSDIVHKVSLDNLPLKSVTGDIALFLDERLSQIAHGRAVIEKQHDTVVRLAQRMGGSFLGASVAANSLSKSGDPEHFEARLKKLLGDDAPIPKKPLGQLDGLYLLVLQTAFQSETSGTSSPSYVDPSVVQVVLGCIALLKDPLSLRDLEDLTGVSCSASVDVLDRLSSVVLFNPADMDKAFCPIHATFPQFLVDPARCTDPQYAVNVSQQQARLAQGCLNVVTSLTSDVANTKNGPTPAETVRKPVPSHVRYACVNWASHIAEAEKTDRLMKMLDKFAAPETVQRWQDTLESIGRLDVVQTALASACKWEDPESRSSTWERLEKALQQVVARSSKVLEKHLPVGSARQDHPDAPGIDEWNTEEHLGEVQQDLQDADVDSNVEEYLGKVTQDYRGADQEHLLVGDVASQDYLDTEVYSAVTRLLVSVTALGESLTQWSKANVDWKQVSDVYVRLGDDFNAAVAAFRACGIDMSELSSVPKDLRSVLEACLAEDATPENLEIYLPDVRKIITRLDQGLRVKESIYHRMVSDQKRSNGADRDSRSSRSDHPRDDIPRPSSRRPDGASSRSKNQFVSSRRKPSNFENVLIWPASSDMFVGGFAPPVTSPSADTRQSRPSTPIHTRPSLGLSNSFPAPRAYSTDLNFPRDPRTNGYGTPQPLPPPPPQPPVPSHVKRFSLVDSPVPPLPAVVVTDGSTPSAPSGTPTLPISPPSESVPLDQSAPGLATLKKVERLERRPSMRISPQNIPNMTCRLTLSGGGGGVGTSQSLLAANDTLNPAELAALAEEGECVSPRQKSSRSQRTRPSPIVEGEKPPLIPSLPPPAQAQTKSPSVQPQPLLPAEVVPEPAVARVSAMSAMSVVSAAELDNSSTAAPTGPFPVFLQVGREVKKVMIEPGLSLSMLRALFVDNFPAIYIRDPSSGVQYELEDVDEVKEKVLLSLNIEPLDEIKQHIDSQVLSLQQDVRDLRMAVISNRRTSTISAQPSAESTHVLVTPQPSEQPLRVDVARRISRLPPDHVATTRAHCGRVEIVGKKPRMTGTSGAEDAERVRQKKKLELIY